MQRKLYVLSCALNVMCETYLFVFVEMKLKMKLKYSEMRYNQVVWNS